MAPSDTWAAADMTMAGQLQVTVNRLVGLTVMLGIGMCLLIFVVVRLVTKEQQIYYVAVTPGLGMSRPGEVPEAAARDFAQSVALHLGNLTPATVEAVYTAMARYLHPHFLPVFQAQAKRDQERIQTDYLSSMLTVRGTRVEQEGQIYRGMVSAMRRVFVGEEMVRDEEVEVVVEFFPAAVSSLNIYGLVITNIHFPQLGRQVAQQAHGQRGSSR
jgi:hypothetical protein